MPSSTDSSQQVGHRTAYTASFGGPRLIAEINGRRIYIVTLLSILYIAYALRFTSPPFFGGDAEHYWRLGSTFFTSGRFNILEGEATFRGYLLPTIFGYLRQAGIGLNLGEFRLFYVVNGLFTAASLAILIPWLFQRIFGTRPLNVHVALFGGLFFFFWRGYLVEPLSDTWSLFVILIAIALVIGAEGQVGWKRLFAIFLGGIALGAAVNIRPIYLICVPLFFAGAFIYSNGGRDQRAIAHQGARIAALAAGCALILLPQAVINQHFISTWNPFVHTGGLYTHQLFFGLSVSRHECAYFIDSAGLKILSKFGYEFLRPVSEGRYHFVIDLTKISLVDYLKIFFNNPIDLFLIYVRHIANGIGLLGSNIYHCQPFAPRQGFILLSVLVAWIGIAAILLMGAVAPLRRYWLLLVIPFVPMLFTVPTAMEGRFFFVVHLSAYAAISFFLLTRAGLARARGRIGMVAVVVLTGTAATTALLGNTFASTYAWLGFDAIGVFLRPEVVLMQP